MNAKVLLGVWAICILWAVTATTGDEAADQSWRFDSTAVEAAHRSHTRLTHATAPGTEPDLVAEWLPIIEARVRNKAPELTATLAATGLMWLVVGAVIRPR